MTALTSPRVPTAYLNMAGSGPVSDEVLAATTTYLKIEQQVGAYDTELDHHVELDERVYENLGTLLGCVAADIAIFDNATRAWTEVVSRLSFKGARRILTTEYEYAGNLQYLKDLSEREGLELITIPCTDKGEIDLEWLQSNMGNDVGLVSVVHVPSCCGIINPVATIGEILSGYQAVYIVDACQAVGQVQIDVHATGCDVLTGAGRKFLCGPRGTGFAFVSAQLRARMSPGFVDLHLSDIKADGRIEKDMGNARFLEMGERNCGAIIGLSRAIEEALHGGDRLNDGIFRIREGVSALEGVIPIDPGRNRGGIFSFRHKKIPAEEVVRNLREHRIAAWRIKGSHTPLYMLPRGHIEGVRLSSNKITVEHADLVVAALKDMLA
ncbi:MULTISPECIES: aminotransferase class V-fold PLP-dependent enzyme [Rhodobacterales]|jgi:selenocysteine lyase/cysteine desulfurase|uniref:Aminotransferase class V-fold PLP-dependent enzyme n=2 Tax=Bacteria TaxID=2 RepID=A0A9Q2NZY8_9RHOB|nr:MULTISPECIES: aminotransferase class V-fold PLP-dependent enzyme [Rhodobacterales]MBM1222756.1 aminotransferase class V-fold PLP-dependent enzyme [Ponticoccus sp. SC6-9]MBM1227380.1 aminotransferase class V-fold PLP-dependent enzyme [Ponticoccus sp. SC6-15]MBM1231682.1 aminotransferase class V-fold PLP-dependent enzyme [Ponticoccus sp. SC6-38]MBM1236255.1 aminotransferase class V-fold PLP-dependent enzyme [Ponticoccus sp. SC6-45]MBM1240705.1 aminotransferase class V-fold PLP-dependent enzym